MNTLGMRRLGLIGGTTYHSTLEYYRIINELVYEQSGSENAVLTLDSLNFGDIVRNSRANDQASNQGIVLAAAQRLKTAGAEAIILCANTMHMFADAVRDQVNLPVIHIAQVNADAIEKQGLTKVALLGTKYTMELDIYHSILAARGIECLVPDEDDKTYVHDTIFNEFASGIFSDELKVGYLQVIERMQNRGAEGVILGCTEIPLLLAAQDIPIPSFDTTRIHCEAAVRFTLG